MMKHYDCFIVGGGAAGMVAAITAMQENPGLTVAIGEREGRVGKKLLVTGNGRCNLTNLTPLDGRYYGDTRFAQCCFEKVRVADTLAFFARHGIPCVEGEDGKCYPRSLQANSVVDQLRFAAIEAGVVIITDCTVSQIQKNKTFRISTNKGDFSANRVLIATGGKSGIGKYDGPTGYDLLTRFGHSVTKLSPGIVQLTTEKEPIKALTGIKVEGTVTLQSGDQTRVEQGEILFTEYGISGPPVLQVSSLVGQSGKATVTLNLLPTLSFDEILQEVQFRCQRFAHRSCEDLLTGFMNKRVGQTVIKRAGIEKLSRLCGSLTPAEQKAVVSMIRRFPLTVTGTKGFANAQVTVGGIKTKDFSAKTMESNLVPGLFAAGEVLNVTGDCGGFNLQWAWTSGILAGKAMAKGEPL